MVQETEHKSFEQPDEARAFPNGEAQIVSIGDIQVGRTMFQPAWRLVSGAGRCDLASPRARRVGARR